MPNRSCLRRITAEHLKSTACLQKIKPPKITPKDMPISLSMVRVQKRINKENFVAVNI